MGLIVGMAFDGGTVYASIVGSPSVGQVAAPAFHFVGSPSVGQMAAPAFHFQPAVLALVQAALQARGPNGGLGLHEVHHLEITLSDGVDVAGYFVPYANIEVAGFIGRTLDQMRRDWGWGHQPVENERRPSWMDLGAADLHDLAWELMPPEMRTWRTPNGAIMSMTPLADAARAEVEACIASGDQRIREARQLDRAALALEHGDRVGLSDALRPIMAGKADEHRAKGRHIDYDALESLAYARVRQAQQDNKFNAGLRDAEARIQQLILPLDELGPNPPEPPSLDMRMEMAGQAAQQRQSDAAQERQEPPAWSVEVKTKEGKLDGAVIKRSWSVN